MSRLIASTALRLMRPDRMSHFADLDRSQWLPAERLAEIQKRKLGEILSDATAKVPFYRQAALDAGLEPGSVRPDDLSNFPLIDKTIMTDRKSDFLAEDTTSADRILNHTGGSTGVWFEFFVDRRSNEIRHAADLRGRTWAGWKIGDRQALLWGHRGDVAQRTTLGGRVRNALFNRSITLNAYNMDDEALESYWREISGFKPLIMIGYASALAFLADHLSRHGRTIPRFRGLISSAETLTELQRETIEGYFDCPLLNRYGSREFGVVAQQCRGDGPLHVGIERVKMEILKPDGTPCAPGERGEIVMTDLDNRAMPFIRYRTGDLATATTDSCSCGRGLPLLSGVEGRVSDLIVGKNGKYYSCQSPRLFGADIPGIAQMQIVQESLDGIEMRIVADGDWNEESRAMLVERMTGLLGDVEVAVTLVDEIPLAPSGKYRFAISSVSPFRR